MPLESIYGDLGPILKTKILKTELGCRFFLLYLIIMCEIAMLEPDSRPLFYRQLFAGSTKIVLDFTCVDGNLCPLVDVTLSWTKRSPRGNSLSSLYDFLLPVKLKFVGKGKCWYTKFATRPNSFAYPIAHLKLKHAAFFVFVWNPWSANYIILSVLVVDPRFNVMSYIRK